MSWEEAINYLSRNKENKYANLLKHIKEMDDKIKSMKKEIEEFKKSEED